MDKRYFQLQELLDEVNQRLTALPDLDQTEFTKRTVYYYVQEGLLPRLPGLRRGPRTRYPAEFVDRLLFIRRLQSQEALALDHIRQVLEETPPETIRRVARGEETLRLARVGEAEPEAGEQTIMLSAAPAAAWEDQGLEIRPRLSDVREPSPEETIPAGPWAHVVVSRRLSPQERRQLQRAAALIESLLEEEE